MDGFLSTRALGNLSSALYLLCGALVAFGAAVLPVSRGSSVLAVEGIALLALVLGIIIALLPWQRWRRSATLWLMPLSLAVVGAFNVATHADGFRYSLFYMVTFVWLGLGHRPGMSLKFAPLLIVAYVVPLWIVGDSASADAASAAYAIPTTLLTGEVVAWVSERVRRGESIVRAREKRFRALVGNAADIITVVSDDGLITYESPPVIDVLGYDPEQTVGTVAAERVHPDDWPRLAEIIADLREQPDGVVRMELRLRHADGSWRWCSAAIRNLLYEPSVRGFVCNLHDVSRERQAMQALADSESSFRMLFASNPRPMWVYDIKTLEFLEVNESAVRHYGYSREEFLSRRITDIRPSEDVARLLESVRGLRPALDHAGHWRHRLRDGTLIDVDITSHRLIFGGRDAVLVDIRDVTDQNALENQLRHRAFHDPLTTLPNRPLFNERVEHALRISRPVGHGIAVLLLDLDRFKTINDSLGHSTGDELLMAVARRISGCLSPGTTAARLGGDEFVVLVEDVGESSDATDMASKIISALEAPFQLSGRDVVVRASVGIVIHRDGPATADELIRSADAAMYAAKAAGSGSWRVFEQSMHDAAVARLELEAQLRGALERGELVVHYQPVIDLSTNALVGREALLRWNHPSRGLVAPLEFIPLAEETGLIIPIGAWVLEQACTDATGWSGDAGLVGLSVNISARQLFDPSFADTVALIVQRTGIEPARLTLEITESVLMEDTTLAVQQLNALKRLGVRVAIDDFGTGYSSLSYLRTFPVDVLKIDKSFIENVATDVEGACFVQAILHLAQVLRVTTVAEGVEEASQAERLTQLGCDCAQGFFFGRPAPLPAREGRSTYSRFSPVAPMLN